MVTLALRGISPDSNVLKEEGYRLTMRDDGREHDERKSRDGHVDRKTRNRNVERSRRQFRRAARKGSPALLMSGILLAISIIMIQLLSNVNQNAMAVDDEALFIQSVLEGESELSQSITSQFDEMYTARAEKAAEFLVNNRHLYDLDDLHRLDIAMDGNGLFIYSPGGKLTASDDFLHQPVGGTQTFPADGTGGENGAAGQDTFFGGNTGSDTASEQDISAQNTASAQDSSAQNAASEQNSSSQNNTSRQDSSAQSASFGQDPASALSFSAAQYSSDPRYASAGISAASALPLTGSEGMRSYRAAMVNENGSTVGLLELHVKQSRLDELLQATRLKDVIEDIRVMDTVHVVAVEDSETRPVVAGTWSTWVDDKVEDHGVEKQFIYDGYEGVIKYDDNSYYSSVFSYLGNFILVASESNRSFLLNAGGILILFLALFGTIFLLVFLPMVRRIMLLQMSSVLEDGTMHSAENDYLSMWDFVRNSRYLTP